MERGGGGGQECLARPFGGALTELADLAALSIAAGHVVLFTGGRPGCHHGLVLDAGL